MQQQNHRFFFQREKFREFQSQNPMTISKNFRFSKKDIIHLKAYFVVFFKLEIYQFFSLLKGKFKFEIYLLKITNCSFKLSIWSERCCCFSNKLIENYFSK